MSTFGIFLETVETSVHHPNADRLDITQLVGIGYPFVTGRDEFKPGDRALYFPPDAELPAAVTDPIGLTGKLRGPSRSRVKACKIRGTVSQGLVVRAEKLGLAGSVPGVDYASMLGVTKYEPPEPGGSPGAARVFTLPEGGSKYDLENAERYKNVVEILMGSDEGVVITEKMEGSHIAATRYKDGRVVLCSRGQSVGEPQEGETENWYWTGARNSNLLESLAQVSQRNPDAEQVTLRGEVTGPGIQGNIYKLDKKQVNLFECEINGNPVDAGTFFEWNLLTPHVPVLWRGPLSAFLNGKSLRDASNGPSALLPSQLREGIVIKPMRESFVDHFGRLVIKQRSPEYLAGSELS